MIEITVLVDDTVDVEVIAAQILDMEGVVRVTPVDIDFV